MREDLSPYAFAGVPGFFQACCRDVKRRRVQAGYDHPAYELMRHLERLCPYDIEEDEWAEHLSRLVPPADKGVLAWFVRHFPECMKWIPCRRRPQFLAGVYRALENGLVDPCATRDEEV